MACCGLGSEVELPMPVPHRVPITPGSVMHTIYPIRLPVPSYWLFYYCTFFFLCLGGDTDLISFCYGLRYIWGELITCFFCVFFISFSCFFNSADFRLVKCGT